MSAHSTGKFPGVTALFQDVSSFHWKISWCNCTVPGCKLNSTRKYPAFSLLAMYSQKEKLKIKSAKINYFLRFSIVIILPNFKHLQHVLRNVLPSKIEMEISKVLLILLSLSRQFQTESRMYIGHPLEIQQETSLKFFFQHASIIM